MTEKELLAVACEQFLGKNVQDIKNVVLQTLEGHLRSILGKAPAHPGTLLLPSRTSQDLQGPGREGCSAGQGNLSVPPRLSFQNFRWPKGRRGRWDGGGRGLPVWSGTWCCLGHLSSSSLGSQKEARC